MFITNIVERILRKRHEQSAREYLSRVNEFYQRYRREVDLKLHKLKKSKDPKIVLGQTEWGRDVLISSRQFLQAHGLILGATGSGKSYDALNLQLQWLKKDYEHSGFGLLDQKGELFQKSLNHISVFLNQADKKTRDIIEKKLHILDFSDVQNITPYNVLIQRGDEKLEFLISNRLDSICELFSGSSALTTKMRQLLKYHLLLFAEHGLPLSVFDRLCDDYDLLLSLAHRSENEMVKRYFISRFKSESKTTLPALRQRIDAILCSDSVRLSLSAEQVPDFKRLMDNGANILINTAGPQISRTTSMLLQMFILGDIRQAIFQRKNLNTPFIWFMDEAQLLFRHPSSRENISDILCMSRSYATFIWLITQSLYSAVRDPEIRNAIACNVRNMLVLRSTLEDTKLIIPAIPITGNMPAPKNHPFEPTRLLNPKEELKARLEEVSSFPDRIGYLWMKTVLDKAIKIKTPLVVKPGEITGESYSNKYIQSSGGIPKEQIITKVKEKISKIENMRIVVNKTNDSGPADTNTISNAIKQLEQDYQKNKRDNK